MDKYKDLELVNNSDGNLSKYLTDKFEKLMGSRVLGSYPVSKEKHAKKMLTLYIDAKTYEEEGVNFSNYSKDCFEELMQNWDKLVPEVKSLILEDCFTNPNTNSEQFLFMRDKKIKNSQAQTSYSYCNSSKYREHLILSDEISTVKEYLAGKRLEELGFTAEDLDKLISRDAKINKYRYGLNKILPKTESDRRRDKLYVEGIFRIATNIEELLYFSEQEKIYDFDLKYFDKETIIDNIREAISDKPNAKSLLSTDIKQIISRANFIRWQDEQTKDGGLLEGERMLFSSRGFIEAITLSTNNFFKDFDRELYLAQDAYGYMTKDQSPMSFRQMYEVGLQECATQEEQDKFKKDFNLLFLSYNFGDYTDAQKERLDDLYQKTVDYYKSLLNELRRVRREEEQTEKDVLVRSERTVPVEVKGGTVRNHRKPVHDVDRVDNFIENVAHSGIRLLKIINVGRIGTPDIGQDGLIYYVFEKNNTTDDRVLVWEPVGQPGNSTLIFKTSKDIDELATEIKNKDVSVDQLVAQKEVYRMWHREGASYNANRLKLIFDTIDENNDDKPITTIMRNVLINDLESEKCSFEYFRRRAIEKVPFEETRRASEFVQNIIKIGKSRLEEIFDMSTPTLSSLRKGIKELKKVENEK